MYDKIINTINEQQDAQVIIPPSYFLL
jgi:septal ring factor EnvC (AmiA/AmiB activator)